MRPVLFIALAGCVDTMPKPPEEPWQSRAELPEMRRRLEAAATSNGTRLVVLGGFSTSPAEVPPQEISREILEYDPFMQTWTKLEVDAPAALTHAGFVGTAGTLYLLGGLSGTTFAPVGEAWKLAPNKADWEPLAPMPPGLERGAAAIVHSPGHIFLFGGETESGFVSTVLDYAIADDEWRQLPDLPTPRSHAAAMRMGDGTFIVAGGIGPQGPLGDVYALPLGGTWTLREPMPTARGGCAYGVLYGQLVCAGGEVAGGEATRIVEAFDPEPVEGPSGKWTALPDMPVERGGAAGAVVTSRLYVVGGAQTSAREPTSTVFEFDLLDTLPR